MKFHYVTEMEEVIKAALLNEKVDKPINLEIKEEKEK
jgi:hypothetical protein